MNRKFRQAVFFLLAAGTAWLIFARPELCTVSLREGLQLCGGPLLVSLFPFLIVSSLAVRSGAGETLGILFCPAARLIGIRGSGARSAGGVLLIGFLGGFAPAASAVRDAVQTGRLTARQASALLPACICSGPSFVVLTVGGQLLGSRALGVRLFAAQLLAGYLTAALLGRLHRYEEPEITASVPEEPLPGLDELIAQATIAYLKLCGFVLYFRLLAAGCGQILPGRLAVLPAMLLEVCSGCDYAARTGLWASSLCCTCVLSVRRKSRSGRFWRRGWCTCRFRWRCSGSAGRSRRRKPSAPCPGASSRCSASRWTAPCWRLPCAA